MFRSTGAGAIRPIRHLKIGGRTHRPNGTPPSCRWTMAIPSFLMETPPTNSQTFPRSQWADGASFRIAKTASRESCRTPVSGTPDFSTKTSTFRSGPVDSRLTALTPPCFHGQIPP